MLVGGAGNDDLRGDKDLDVMNGGDGRDELNGGGGGDQLTGGEANDVVSDGGGADVVDGGVGNDIIRPSYDSTGGDVFAGGEGSDQLDLWTTGPVPASRSTTLRTMAGAARSSARATTLARPSSRCSGRPSRTP